MKIVFVCLGNICRSPMAEMIMKNIVRKRNLENDFVIASVGISDEEEGNDIYSPAKRILQEKGIPIEKRRARKITQQDIDYYDYIIVMERYQLERIIKNYNVSDVSKVMCLNSKDVADPWYSGNFEITYEEIYSGCLQLLKKLEKEL